MGLAAGVAVALREEKIFGIIVWMTLVKLILLSLRAIQEWIRQRVCQ